MILFHVITRFPRSGRPWSDLEYLWVVDNSRELKFENRHLNSLESFDSLFYTSNFGLLSNKT